MEFMGSWSTQEREGVISWDEFNSVMCDLSFGVESDAEFHTFLEAAWKC